MSQLVSVTLTLTHTLRLPQTCRVSGCRRLGQRLRRSSVVSSDLAGSASLTPLASALVPSSPPLPSLALGGGGGGADGTLFAPPLGATPLAGRDSLLRADTLGGAGAVTEVPLPQSSPQLPPCVRIWAGTWNMAEIAPPPGAMAALLPPGCDVYAFGLQECMHTDALLGALRGHLGEGYLEVHHRVGSTIKRLGYHGHIAVAVYIKE